MSQRTGTSCEVKMSLKTRGKRQITRTHLKSWFPNFDMQHAHRLCVGKMLTVHLQGNLICCKVLLPALVDLFLAFLALQKP